ncbi:hypothetical protein CLV58_113117 [Spirosoma oryzae]|uniref:Uncharacterized protein n=1 Tax=Spirosoma oryzae TaxID=1469603 RepID=A0A2T0SRF6_9BACT|nr:hypothetical protein [Spirosoma oryzae]PRY35986.1 hypothetical protein CLV58_113117 [Spirosoma oryzae]
METTTTFIRRKLAEIGASALVTPQQLQQALALLPRRPSLGAPEHADDRHDDLAAYYALGPYHSRKLNLQPTRTIRRTSLLEPVRSFRSVADSSEQIDFVLTTGDPRVTKSETIAVKDVIPGTSFNPKLRVRLQAIFCRNDDGLLSGARVGQTAQVLGPAMQKIVAAVNEIFVPMAGIEFVFYPSADLEIVNNTRLNQDFVLPAAVQEQLSKKTPLTAQEMEALANQYTTTPDRNTYAARYPEKMVLLYAEGTTYNFDDAAQRWVLSSPSGGGFSWEDLEFVKLSGEIGTTDGEAHGYVHGFQAHEMGHFLHLWHTFGGGFYLSNAEFTDPTTTIDQKLALIRKRVTDYIEDHRTEAPNGDLTLLLDGDRGAVTDTPPDEGTHILQLENMLAGTGNACGKDGTITLTLSDGTPVTYSPDRTLAMSYYKGCFDNTYSPQQVERMRKALTSGNRRRIVKTQLGDTAAAGEYVCACWKPNANAQAYVWGMDLNALKAKAAALAKQGLYLTSQQAYTKQGITRYDGIFNPSKNAPYIIWGWAVADFQAENTKQQAAGKGLTHLDSYLLADGQVRINAIWYAGAASANWIQGYAQADFGKQFFDRAKANQRLIHLNSWCLPNNGGIRYDAVWVPGNNKQYAFVNLTMQEFQQKYGEMWGSKRKLTIVDAVRSGNEIRYSGIWDPDTNAQYVVWGYTREQVRQMYDEMWQQGMKLQSMSTAFF